jgi:phospholipid-translocating ATPase
MGLGQAARPSFTMNRPSFNRASIGGIGRPSTSGRSIQPVRAEIDQWLRERENDFANESIHEDSPYDTPRDSPRPSGLARMSSAWSEARSSIQIEEMDEMVDENVAADEAAVIERCFQHINDFATEGLRTLLYGYRFLDEGEYTIWKKGYLDATTSLVNRAQLIEEAGELIEQQLELAGATAIEDKLQHGVPEAIDKLRRAKIKMWMLTGDKRETAINIGHSCRLIKDYSTVTVLDHETGEVEQSMGAAILAINGGKVAHSVIVIDGQTLSQISEIEPLNLLFYDLAILADSVICCRASPAQKASLVKNIRKRVKKSITLAIGDGANDIAMIQEAHVGIGITGKEGLQAARTSDYSIAQFRFLTKLLLVHGRWNYIRTCKYVASTFWKEMVSIL